MLSFFKKIMALYNWHLILVILDSKKKTIWDKMSKSVFYQKYIILYTYFVK